MKADPKPYRRSWHSRTAFDVESWLSSIGAFGRGWAIEYWDGGDHGFRWFWFRRCATAWALRQDGIR